MSYYLVYGTFETERQRVAHRRMVNYYLDYRTSETIPNGLNLGLEVNYYLIYSTSETARVRQAHPNPVNYCLDYRTSETRTSVR